MRVLVQRVSRAAVRVRGEAVGEIGRGLLVLAGFAPADGEEELAWVARKLMGLRVFEDGSGRMNRSLDEIGGEMLVIPQFTLYGDVARGRRPSFVGAAPPKQARVLYERFLDVCRGGSVPVASGEFGAHMEVELVNDGPVTLMVER